MQRGTPYIDLIRQTLPRLLSFFDRDKSSKSLGVGDRYYWAWGLIDFPNGTFQGSAHGLARLWRQGLWPYSTALEDFISHLDTIFRGAKFSTRTDGSLEEAFPNEGSYCVTALVAFDLLQAIDLMGTTDVSSKMRKEWLQTVEPMVEYLVKKDETHAIISNHLATAVAALTRWHKETGDISAENKARTLLDRILDCQSDEGWFEEYGGADPGYETLCLHYLADVHRLRPDWALLQPLRKSVKFLWYFAHPDGSFGGLYGSRCTRFYYPSGVLALSREIPEADALARYMADSVKHQRVVTLSAIDEPNLVPMFNSYCWAAEIAAQPPMDSEQLSVPALRTEAARVSFPHAGLLLDRGEHHYTVVSTHKGGGVSHFPDDGQAMIDAGVVVRHPNGKLGSTQAYVPDNAVEINEDKVIVQADFHEMTKRLPGPFGFLVLRIFCLSVFRISPVREWVKQRLVNWLIKRRKTWPASNRRTIRLGANLDISDVPSLPSGYELIEGIQQFVSIHMASQGYWQSQDEERPR